MGKGSSKQPSEVSQTTIPEYAKPYMESLLGRTEALTMTPTPQYQGQAFADPTVQQMEVRQRAANLQLPGGFRQGQLMAQAAGQRALQASQYNPFAFGMERVRGPQLDPVRQFSAAEAQAYESPYMQRVLDVQKRRAIEDAQKAQLGANLGAARRGTYGGARQALLQAEREKALGEQLGTIEATGRQKAFEQAQTQFERDRAAQLGVQELRAKQMQEANLANQLRFLETQKAQEASRQFGAGLGLKGLEQLRLAGATAADIGKAEAATEMGQLKLQDAIAKQRQIEEQRQLDYLQQQFQARQKDPYKRLQFMSDILRGTGNIRGGEALYSAPQTALQQIVGTGLPAYGLYRSLQGQG